MRPTNYYRIDTDWDENNNSPWDAVWHDLDEDNGDDCLSGVLPLRAIWRSPTTTLQKRLKRPDVYCVVRQFAVTKRTRDVFAAIVGDEVEFLPLKVPNLGTLFLIHSLRAIDFDKHAVVSSNSGNITFVRKYSFTVSKRDGPQHMFRMLHPKGSAARDVGIAMNDLIVSEEVKRAAEKAKVKGIAFLHVCST